VLLHAIVFVEVSILFYYSMQTCFTIYLWLTKLLSIRLELFISPKLQVVLKMSSIFSRNKLMIPIVLFQSLWMFFLWLMFTSNLISQTTWLKVKLVLVNLYVCILTSRTTSSSMYVF